LEAGPSAVSMEYLIGVVLAVVVAGFARIAGFDRDRVFYPTLLIVITSYYILFAVMGASVQVLVGESLVTALFLIVAVVGFKMNLWLVVAALAGHGVFDFFHRLFLENAGVPVWWPGFCMAFDVVAGGWLGGMLMKRPDFARKG
jgi:hypothetical protein